MKAKLCTGHIALGVLRFLFLKCKQKYDVKKENFAVVQDVFRCLLERRNKPDNNDKTGRTFFLLQPMTMTTDEVKE